MDIEDVQGAVKQAELEIEIAEGEARTMAELLIGRLRMVSRDNDYWSWQILRKLKAELKNFNSHNGQWK